MFLGKLDLLIVKMFMVYCFSADLVTEAQRIKNGLNFVTLSISENSIRHYLNGENIKLLDQDHEPLPKGLGLRMLYES